MIEKISKIDKLLDNLDYLWTLGQKRHIAFIVYKVVINNKKKFVELSAKEPKNKKHFYSLYDYITFSNKNIDSEQAVMDKYLEMLDKYPFIEAYYARKKNRVKLDETVLKNKIKRVISNIEKQKLLCHQWRQDTMSYGGVVLLEEVKFLKDLINSDLTYMLTKGYLQDYTFRQIYYFYTDIENDIYSMDDLLNVKSLISMFRDAKKEYDFAREYFLNKRKKVLEEDSFVRYRKTVIADTVWGI